MAKAKKTKSKTTTKKVARRGEFYLYVSYPYDLYWSLDLDRQIERAARVPCDGSGIGFGLRDISFTFKTRKGADNAVARIRKLHRKIKTDLIEQYY